MRVAPRSAIKSLKRKINKLGLASRGVLTVNNDNTQLGLKLPKKTPKKRGIVENSCIEGTKYFGFLELHERIMYICKLLTDYG